MESANAQRPEFEEFFSALTGFLDKKSAPFESSLSRFLEIFCRSVGAGEGHVFKRNSAGRLESIESIGLPPTFDEEFNKIPRPSNAAPAPFDTAFNEKKVIAVVDIKQHPHFPPWFLSFMQSHGFQSMVAVPLMGHDEAVGVLCSYYHDVCLFDEGTLDRLLGIGRMIGAAMEKNAEPAPTVTTKNDPIDQLLGTFTRTAVTKAQAFSALVQAVEQTIPATVILAGLVKKSLHGVSLTLVEGRGVPSMAVSQSFEIPEFIKRKLGDDRERSGPFKAQSVEMAGLRPMINLPSISVLCQPLLNQDKLHGAVIIWRNGQTPFILEDDVLLKRLAGIVAMAMI